MSTDTAVLLTVVQVQNRLSLGRSKVYSMIWDGTLPSIRIGRSVRISAKALEQWVEEQEKKAED